MHKTVLVRCSLECHNHISGIIILMLSAIKDLDKFNQCTIIAIVSYIVTILDGYNLT